MNNRKTTRTKKRIILVIVLVTLVADYFIISAAVRGVQFIADYFEKLLFETLAYRVEEQYETEPDTCSYEEEEKILKDIIEKQP